MTRGPLIDSVYEDNGRHPAVQAIDGEIADLEAFIAERPPRAQTLGIAIEALRQKSTNLERSSCSPRLDGSLRASGGGRVSGSRFRH
jgi:hypothetical protein